MKALLTMVLLATVASAALAADAKMAPGKTGEAVLKTAQDFFAAWNKHDVPMMVSTWTDDATLINPMGRAAHGKAELQKLFADEQGTMLKNSTANVLNMDVTRTLGSDMAFCDGEVTIDGAVGPDGSAMPQMKDHMTVVMEKKGGHWLIADARAFAFVQPPPAPASGN